MAAGTLAGLPLLTLFAYGWSRVPLAALSLPTNGKEPGVWGMLLISLVILGAIAAFLVGLAVVHELIHVVAFPRFGLSPETVFGVWPRRFLPYAHHTGPLSCLRLVLVALAPLMVLSAAPLFGAIAGLLRSPAWALVSIMNAAACGGDLVIVLAVACQVPWNGTVRSKGWDTWWRPAKH